MLNIAKKLSIIANVMKTAQTTPRAEKQSFSKLCPGKKNKKRLKHRVSVVFGS
jgi:hypothetical protein